MTNASILEQRRVAMDAARDHANLASKFADEGDNSSAAVHAQISIAWSTVLANLPQGRAGITQVQIVGR